MAPNRIFQFFGACASVDPFARHRPPQNVILFSTRGETTSRILTVPLTIDRLSIAIQFTLFCSSPLAPSKWMRRGMSSPSILSRRCRRPCPPRLWATREIASALRYATYQKTPNLTCCIYEISMHSLHPAFPRTDHPLLSKLRRGA